MKKLSWRLQAEDQGKSMEQIMRDRLGLTKRQISRAKFTEGGILLQGERRRTSHIGREGELLEVFLRDQERPGRVEPRKGGLDILYEDEDLLVLNKPPGIPCHPGRGHYLDSLANTAAWYLEEKGEKSLTRLAGRLDKDTSGVVVFAKNRAAAQRLGEQRTGGLFQKTYKALIKGKLAGKTGRISEPIRKVPGEKLKMQVSPQGKTGETEYEVLGTGEDCTLVLCRIVTGRTHQIRVHMAWLGHPLFGDVLYGTGENPFFEGLALHCESAEFYQPFTGERIFCRAPAPGWRLPEIR